jgi:hypothetical protein
MVAQLDAVKRGLMADEPRRRIRYSVGPLRNDGPSLVYSKPRFEITAYPSAMTDDKP